MEVCYVSGKKCASTENAFGILQTGPVEKWFFTAAGCFSEKKYIRKIPLPWATDVANGEDL